MMVEGQRFGCRIATQQSRGEPRTCWVLARTISVKLTAVLAIVPSPLRGGWRSLRAQRASGARVGVEQPGTGVRLPPPQLRYELSALASLPSPHGGGSTDCKRKRR